MALDEGVKKKLQKRYCIAVEKLIIHRFKILIDYSPKTYYSGSLIILREALILNSSAIFD